MTARVIDGRQVADSLLDEVQGRAKSLRARGITPCLAFVMVGESGPALVYARRLERLAVPRGIVVRLERLDATVSQTELDRIVSGLNAAPDVDGVLVQLPLPDHLDADLSELIDPRKDVDGITVSSAGRLYLEMPGQVPSTALAMLHLLESQGIDPLGRHAVVVGRSKIVGHPVAELLLRRDATVTVTHRQTRSLAMYTRQAEILMVAAGEPHLITADMLTPGVVVIDAGINTTEGGIVGDVDFLAACNVASAITPVPGGVGPVTNAMLLRSVLQSAESRGV